VNDVVWDDPPGVTQASAGWTVGKWVGVLEPLMAHPKRWARIQVSDTPTAAYWAAGNLRKGAVNKPPGRWEFAARRILEADPPQWGVWARYLGEADQ
jgi:hypothetical protein